MLRWVSRLKDRATAELDRQRDRRDWLDHLMRAGARYKAANGDHLAAAITYFSFLSLFPLLLLAMSVAGFVLNARPDLLKELTRTITETIPGEFGGTLVDAVNTAVQNRGTVGVVGLLGVAYAGLGWIGNLRKATMVIWQTDRRKQPNVAVAKAGDLLALVGCGIAAVVSLALTAVVTAAAGWLLRITGLDDLTGMGTLTRVFGLLVAAVGDTLIFGWLLARLPRIGVPYRSVLKGAVFAAVGFGVLKVVGTFYVQQVSHSPTAGLFGSVIGTLVWLNLVSRFLLYAVAWTACDRVFIKGVFSPLLGLSTDGDVAEAQQVTAEQEGAGSTDGARSDGATSGGARSDEVRSSDGGGQRRDWQAGDRRQPAR